MKAVYMLVKQFIVIPLAFLLCFSQSINCNAQGTWIEQAVQPTMSGITLTKTGSDCIIHTRSSSRYVYFFDINCKKWSEIDLGIQQTIKAVEAGKHVVFAYSDSLLVAYSSVTSTYHVIEYYGKILSPNGPGGLSDSLVLFQSGNVFDVYDASTENTTTFNLGGTAGYAKNGGNIILLSNSNFSRFYAFQKGSSEWVELIPESNSLWFIPARNTAVVARNTKVYAFAPDDFTGVSDEKANQSEALTITQNYPNPFYPSTNISFSITAQSFVTLKIVNSLGIEVATLVSKKLPAGTHNFKWNASGLPTGLYFSQLQSGEYFVTRKLILIK